MSSYKINTQNDRIITFDILRIVAAFAVVLLHVSAHNWHNSFPSAEWEIRNVYDSISRWCVPVFVMISGALFLNSHKPLKLSRLYRKNVLRIFIAFLFWSFVYAIYNCMVSEQLGNYKALGARFISGPFHLWFLKMLIGLYIIIPVLRPVVIKRRNEIYFLCLSLVTVFIVPTLLKVIGWFSADLAYVLTNGFKKLELNIAIGYSGYFVLGHYLYNYKINSLTRKTIYCLGFFSFICVVCFTHFTSHYIHSPYSYFYSNLNPFTLLEAAAVYVWVLSSFKQVSNTAHRYIIQLSNCSFGIYLVHPLVLDIINRFMPSFHFLLLMLYIPLISFFIFFVSYLVIKAIRQIPFLKSFVT